MMFGRRGAAYQLRLTESEIQIQETQLSLLIRVDRLSQNASAEILADLNESQHWLENRIAAFQRDAERYMGLVDMGAEWEDIPADLFPDPKTNDEQPVPEELVEEDEDDIADAIPTEKMAIALPSMLGLARCTELGLEEMAKQELELRKGQANDALHHICISVAQKSFLFRSSVRQANSQKKKT
ncbi:hypothetical protein EW146_g8191 [Bondarzewia mesenterica]|uniref:Uncharacterized protein n=1 Tax=Bondarzewia mesenterica TaxID=1095465 RepID=A0A4S4LH05_9AGAM|nr:hypothetical protein EW146_g8191 [Bondarzewia mesenterica]